MSGFYIQSDILLYEKIVCGECGNTYRRFKGGTPKADWRCKTRILKGTPCSGRIVKEKDVEEVVVEVFQKVIDLRSELEARKEQCENDEKIRKIKEKITALTDAEDAIHDKVSRFAESGVLDQAESESEITTELERMKAQLDEIQTQKDELLRQKADYDFKAWVSVTVGK